MKRMLSISIAGALVALLLAGCAGSQSGSAYSTSQTRGEMHIRMGVVESVRTVIIEGSRSGVGAVAGGAIGGIAGSNVGQGRAPRSARFSVPWSVASPARQWKSARIARKAWRSPSSSTTAR